MPKGHKMLDTPPDDTPANPPKDRPQAATLPVTLGVGTASDGRTYSVPTDHTQCAPADPPMPPWLPLAERLIARLAESEGMKHLQKSSRASLEAAASEDSEELDWGQFSRKNAGDEPAQDSDPGPDKSPDPDLDPDLLDAPILTLQPADRLILYRLAATFAPLDPFLALTQAGRILWISGIPAKDLVKIKDRLLYAFLPRDWQVYDRYRPGKPNRISLVVPTIEDDTRVTTTPQRLTTLITRLLDVPDPMLILMPDIMEMPAELADILPPPLRYARLTRGLLAQVFAEIHGLDPAATDAFARSLPDDAILARLPATRLTLAFRAASPEEALQRLTPPDQTHTGPRLEDMAGTGPALETARRLVADLSSWRAGAVRWADMTRSLLLYGPPGTGKTHLARAVGQSAGISFVSGSFAAWQAAGHLGDMLRAMRACFAQAIAERPSVLFIDEVDSVGSRFSSDHHATNYRTQVINGFLQEIDALNRQEGVLLIGACNRPETLDPAILRPGRFDLHVEVPPPDVAMIAALLTKALPETAQDLTPLARQLVGYSTAQVDALIREGRSRARAAGRAFGPSDILPIASVDNEAERRILTRIALHECGHALVAHRFWPGAVRSIQIHADGGVTERGKLRIEGLITDVEAHIAVHMAGRAAERLVLGSVCGGAGGDTSSDLAIATNAALSIDHTLGLGAEGPVWRGEPNTAVLADPALRARVRQRLEAGEASAVEILSANRALLCDMATELCTAREMAGEALQDWLSKLCANVAHDPPDDLSDEAPRGPDQCAAIPPFSP